MRQIDRAEKTVKEGGRREIFIFVFVLLLQAVIMTAVLFLCRARYEVSDDFVMELIVTGAFDGKADPHMMFSSFLWGKMLIFFFRAAGWINWYLVWQMATVFMTFACVSILLVRTRKWAMVLFLLTILHLYFGEDLYLLLQFTKIAAAAIAAGGCLFIRNLFHEKKWSLALVGGATLILGCLIRHNSLLIAGSYLAVYFILETARLLTGSEGNTRRELKKIITGLFLLAVLVIGLRAVNNLSYRLSPEYHYYMEYSYLRSAILDGQLPDYEECREAFEEAGISENSYMMIRKWSFADRNFFTPERMRKAGEIIEAWRKDHRPDLEELMETYENRETGSYPAATGLLLLSAAGLLLSPWSLPAAAAGTILTGGLSMYLLWRGHMVYRVEYGLMFSQAVLLLFSMGMGDWGIFRREKKDPCGRFRPFYDKWIPVAISFMLVLLAGYITWIRLPCCLPDRSWEDLSQEDYRKGMDRLFYESWNYYPEKYTAMTEVRTIRPAFMKEVQSHPENLYLMDFGTSIQSYYYDFDPLTALSSGSFQNTIYLGGVTVNHPSVDRALEKWGLDEALPGLLQENVYLVSNNTQELILEYLRTFYDSRVELVAEGEYDGYSFWSYRTGD